MSADIQEKHGLFIQEDELDSVGIADPEGVRFFLCSVQFVSSQCRVEGVFPENKFLSGGFTLNSFRQFPVVLLKLVGYTDVLDPHLVELQFPLMRLYRQENGWSVSFLPDPPAIPFR